MSNAGQTFRELYEATPVSERPPCQLWWERPLPEPGPLRAALAEPQSDEERRVMTTRRQPCTPAAQPVQTAPTPRRYCVVLICKWDVDYYLEYRQEPDKTWTLVDAPAQLEALKHLPITEHREEVETAGYAEQSRKYVVR